jgi:hypothetical protein
MTVTQNGVSTGVCDLDSGFVNVKAWCPVEYIPPQQPPYTLNGNNSRKRKKEERKKRA